MKGVRCVSHYNCTSYETKRQVCTKRNSEKCQQQKKINIAYVKFNMSGLCTFYNFARNPQQCNMYGQHLFVDIHPTKASGVLNIFLYSLLCWQ